MTGPRWKDETELWGYLVRRLRGRWYRLEFSYPAGLCDSMGLWRGQTIWLEHKVGRPSINAFKPAQIEFAHDCFRHHVPWWCCFGHLDRVMFYSGLDFDFGPSPVPQFWVPPNDHVALRPRPRRKASAAP